MFLKHKCYANSYNSQFWMDRNVEISAEFHYSTEYLVGN